MADLAKLVDDLSKLTVLEAAELTKLLAGRILTARGHRCGEELGGCIPIRRATR